MSRFLAFGASLLLAACISTARIETGDSQRPKDWTVLPGIPFYPKQAVCRQDTVWLEPVYVLTREDTDSKNTRKTSQVKVATRTDLMKGTAALGKLYDLQEAFNALAEGRQNYDDKWKAIVATGSLSINPPGNPADVVLAGNNVVAETFVDYSRPYYFNTRMPWIGSSTATAALAPDGTLANATAQADNQTVKAFLDLLPINALLTAKLGAAPAGGQVTEAAPPGESKPPVQLHALAIETILFQHTLTKRVVQTRSPCTLEPPIMFDANSVKTFEYRWQPMATQASNADKKQDEGKKPGEQKKGSGRAPEMDGK